MEILGIIIPIAAICNFFLGLFVLFSDFSKKLNRFFGFFCFLTSIWIFTNFMMGIQPNLFWLKSASAFGVLVPLSGLLWVLELCEKKISKLNLISLIILGLFFFVISYSNDLVLSNIRKIYLGGFEGERGPFFIPFWCYIFGILLFIIYILISSYLKATGIRRLQLLYVIIGAILYMSTVVGVSFILPLFEIRHFIPLDTPSSIFLIFFTTLAITRYHLFEIKVILTEILVGAMGIVLLILPFLMPTANLKLLTFSIFLLFLIFGYLLIKYTHQEIKRKEELEEAYKKIEALSEMKSEFLKVVNHQLRTPFSIIKGLVSMMSEGEVSPERQKEFIQKLNFSVERLGTILDDILAAQSLVGGMEAPILLPCQIEEIVKMQVEHFKPQAEAKGIKISFKKPKEPLPITLADQQMIERIISRLIDNAILYSEKGEIEVSVDLERENKKEWIKISVKDEGIGLDEKEKENIFKLFYRGEKATSMHPNGSGLGLFIVKNYVEAHRGKIEAKSEGRGKGSTFIVALPVITEL